MGHKTGEEGQGCVRRERGGAREGKRREGTNSSDGDPGGKQESGIFRGAGEIEDPGGDVGDQGVGGEEADHGCGGGVVLQPCLAEVGVLVWGCVRCEGEGRGNWAGTEMKASEAKWKRTYQRDMRQSMKKYDRYAEAEHCMFVNPHTPN